MTGPDLTAARLRSGLNRAQFARKLGVTQAQLRLLEDTPGSIVMSGNLLQRVQPVIDSITREVVGRLNDAEEKITAARGLFAGLADASKQLNKLLGKGKDE